jgi:hypothetical protein
VIYLENTEVKSCGIIMPIAAISGYSQEHWLEVKQIFIEASEMVDGINFKTEIVSNSNGEIDVIHKRIIQNLYNSDIVICDISGRNPNVLFELGMRLTFDKPTILIKDDATDFIFDTGVIEHITYPKDLNYGKVVLFKKELARRIKSTYETAQSNPNFSTFLGNFGEFKIPTLNQTTVSDVNQVILDELNTIRNELTYFKKEVSATKLEKTKLKNIIPASIQKYINKYIEDTNDLADPRIVLHKEEFINYLALLGIDISNTNPDWIEKFIKDAQDNILPF